MKPEESFVGQPVRSLQTMLRTIAQAEPRQLSVVPDGVYSRQTTDAVSSFQRRSGKNATGVADEDTWNLIVREYRKARIETEPAQVLKIVLDSGEILDRNSNSPHIYLVQSILTVLSLAYPGIPMPRHTGKMDHDTASAVIAFQLAAGLPATGSVDKTTWKQLALHYALAAGQTEE